MTSETRTRKAITHIRSASIELEQATLDLEGSGDPLIRALAAGLRLQEARVQLDLAAEALFTEAEISAEDHHGRKGSNGTPEP